jgi:uncharacterized membrane protein
MADIDLTSQLQTKAQTAAQPLPRSGRGRVERIGLLTIVAGMFTTIVIGGLLRALKVSEHYEFRGWIMYTTYPLAHSFYALGILIAIIGIGVTLVGKAIR